MRVTIGDGGTLVFAESWGAFVYRNSLANFDTSECGKMRGAAAVGLFVCSGVCTRFTLHGQGAVGVMSGRGRPCARVERPGEAPSTYGSTHVHMAEAPTGVPACPETA